MIFLRQKKLQTEAETLLNQYKLNLQNASVEADRIIAKAKQQAEDIRKQAEIDFTETITRRETMLKTRIDQMERSAIDDIRRYAAELAISATTKIVSQKLSEQKASSLTDASIQNISDKLN